MEIQFDDESEYQNERKWYFYIENSQLELHADVSGNIFPFPSKTKNNFRGIDISQPTPLMSLSVPLFSLELIHHLYDLQGDINNVWPLLAYICSQQTI